MFSGLWSISVGLTRIFIVSPVSQQLDRDFHAPTKLLSVLTPTKSFVIPPSSLSRNFGFGLKRRTLTKPAQSNRLTANLVGCTDGVGDCHDSVVTPMAVTNPGPPAGAQIFRSLTSFSFSLPHSTAATA